MPPTFQALGVLLLAILPGASYTFAYERVFGAFGLSVADRLIRFFAASAVFAALFSAPALVLYRDYVVTGRLAAAEVDAVWFGVLMVAYVAVPTLFGSLAGIGHRARWSWLKAILGDSPEPRAWDYVWRHGTEGLVRARLKSGTWVGGLFATAPNGEKSYASGYPEEGDLYLSQQVATDPDSGEFQLDDGDRPVLAHGGGLLLRWSEIEFLDVQKYRS